MEGVQGNLGFQQRLALWKLALQCQIAVRLDARLHGSRWTERGQPAKRRCASH